MSLPGDIDNVLVLGGGDGLAVRELRKFDDVKRIDLVDIDPAVTRLAMELGPLRRLNEDALYDPRVTLYHQDAFTFVRRQRSETRRWDRVVIDLPDPHDASLAKLYSVEFYKLLADCMSDDAVLVCQSSSPLFTRRAFWCTAESMQQAGLQTHSYTIPLASFGPWGFHLAAKQSLDHSSPQIDESKTRYMTNNLFATAASFGKDESQVETVANRLFEPTIYLYYLNDLNQP